MNVHHSLAPSSDRFTVWGKGWVMGRFSDSRSVTQNCDTAPSLLTLSPASRGERNGRSRALRARNVI